MPFLFGPFFFVCFSGGGGGFEGNEFLVVVWFFVCGGLLIFTPKSSITSMNYRCSADLTSSITYLDMLKALIHA